MKHSTAISVRRILMLALIALAGLLPVAPAIAQNVLRSDWADVAEKIRPLVATGMDEGRVTGLTIVLVDGDEVVWSEGFGFADASAGTKVTADTMFEIGSVSKTFTGLMVMKLAEEGKLDIDRPITDYIPSFRLGPPAIDFPRNDRPITVRDMMTHHSGIPGDLLNGGFTTVYDPDFNRKLLAWLAEDSATYPPGYRWSYSNTAVSLLAEVIAAASGKSFSEYSDAFLASLGMAPASYFKDDPALLARLTKAYNDGTELPTTYINVPASGSIVASANQMGRYLRMLLGRGSIDGTRIVRPETLGAMLVKQNEGAALDAGLDMGLSFILTDPALAWSGPLFWHNGGTIAFHSHMEILPSQGLAAMVIGNSAGSESIVPVVANELLTTALKLKRGQTAPTIVDAVKPTRVTLPGKMLENFAGIYTNDNSGQYHILVATSEGLSWTSVGAASSGGRKDEGILLPWSDGFFRTSENAPLAYEFKEISGQFAAVAHRGNLQGVWATRYVPRKVPEAWKARTGAWVTQDSAKNDMYEVVGLPRNIALGISDGMLVMERYDSLLVLDPVSDSTAAVRGLGRIGGSAARVVTENGGERIRFMQYTYGR